MRHIFHAEARDELAEDAEFYERRVPGLGDDFLDEVVAGIRRILEAPLRWRKIDGDIRRHVIHRFPYSILYSVEDSHIFIVAIMHHSREPGYWQHRLPDQ